MHVSLMTVVVMSDSQTSRRTDLAPTMIQKVVGVVEEVFYPGTCLHTRGIAKGGIKQFRLPWGGGEKIKSTFEDRFGEKVISDGTHEYESLLSRHSVQLALLTRGMSIKENSNLTDWDSAIARCTRDVYMLVCRFFMTSHMPDTELENIRLRNLKHVQSVAYYVDKVVSFIIAWNFKKPLTAASVNSLLSAEVLQRFTYNHKNRTFTEPILVSLGSNCTCGTPPQNAAIPNQMLKYSWIGKVVEVINNPNGFVFAGRAEFKSAKDISVRFPGAFGSCLLLGMASFVVVAHTILEKHSGSDPRSLSDNYKHISMLLEINQQINLAKHALSSVNSAFQVCQAICIFTGNKLTEEFKYQVARLLCANIFECSQLTSDEEETVIHVVDWMIKSSATFPLAVQLRESIKLLRSVN